MQISWDFSVCCTPSRDGTSKKRWKKRGKTKSQKTKTIKKYDKKSKKRPVTSRPKFDRINMLNSTKNALSLQEILNLICAKTGSPQKIAAKQNFTRCSAHPDKAPSLSVSQGDDGKILFFCHRGCTAKDICASIGLTEADLFPTKNELKPKVQPKRTAEYQYTDEHGKVLYRKVRLEPGPHGQSKSFFCERYDANGKLVHDLDGCRKVLYRLPEVLQAIAEQKIIFLVEGEKDADNLAKHGLVATTALQSIRWDKEFTAILRNADVVILHDQDRTGLKRRDMLCRELFGQVRRLRDIDLPGLDFRESHGEDISDWLKKEGNTFLKFQEIVEATPDYLPKQSDNQAHDEPQSTIRAISFHDFLDLELPRPAMILSPFLWSQGLVLLYAKRGVGKTHIALGIAYAVASGGDFLKWSAQEPKKVLYIDGEMPAFSMQERLRKITTEDQKKPMPGFLNFITPDLQEKAMPNLSTEEGRAAIEEFIQDSDVIIIDNLSSLFRSGSENEAESWLPTQEWALELRRRGKCVLFVHHAGKSGQQRGTSKKEDLLDVVISLKQPDDYQPEQGANFEIHFEKTRHFAGEDAITFQVQLKEHDDGTWEWEMLNARTDPELIEIAQLMSQGKTIAQIVDYTGLSKSQVETRMKKARQAGLVNKQ